MSFNKIIEQDIAIKALKNIISQGQVSGTYLFLGPDGVGKRTTAIEFSKAINCVENNSDSCDTCVSCARINSLNHPDIFIIEKEKGSNFIKIERIREMIYQASLKPYEAKKKVFIVLDAEDMNEESSNAFLKLLEEPPQNQIFILTTSRISGILSTVLSRCRVIKFNLLSRSGIQNFLVTNCSFSKEEANLFSHMGMGSIGNSVSLKEKNGINERDRMLNDFFFKKRVIFREDSCDEKKYNDIEESLNMLLYWYRDLLVAKFTDNKALFLNIDRCDEIFSYRDNFSVTKLENDAAIIVRTLGYIRRNVNPKMALFNMALELER